jgi:hypothetical protein
MAAFIIAAMDDHPGGARCAHFAEGDLLQAGHCAFRLVGGGADSQSQRSAVADRTVFFQM